MLQIIDLEIIMRVIHSEELEVMIGVPFKMITFGDE
jgi:hypothetical protein